MWVKIIFGLKKGQVLGKVMHCIILKEKVKLKLRYRKRYVLEYLGNNEFQLDVVQALPFHCKGDVCLCTTS